MDLIKFDNNYRIDLLNVDFKFKLPELELSNDNQVSLKMYDQFNIEKFDTEDIYIKFTRRIFHEPDYYYHLLVTLGIEYKINQDSDKKVNKDNLKEELNKYKDKLLYPVSQKASLLISNITNADDDLLIITPPYFLDDETESFVKVEEE